VDGAPASIFFSEHAIERIRERLIPSALDYAAWGELYAFLDTCRYFEQCELSDGSHSLSFYQDCFVDQASEHVVPFMTNLAMAIVGSAIHAVPPEVRWYYRVGYAPAARYGNCWVLKSLLPPGYGRTPEHTALKTASMQAHQRHRRLKQLDGWTAHSLVGTSDFDVLQWFQANSNAQVVPFEGDLFADQVRHRSLRPPRKLTLSEASVPRDAASPVGGSCTSGFRVPGRWRTVRFVD